jgi:hypothetical protein
MSMSYGSYYVLFLVCVAILFVLLVDFARNRAEQRDGYLSKDSKGNHGGHAA